MSNKIDVIKKLIDAGADIAGSAAGGVLGFLLAGPGGAALGGASGPLLTRSLKSIGEEVNIVPTPYNLDSFLKVV